MILLVWKYVDMIVSHLIRSMWPSVWWRNSSRSWFSIFSAILYIKLIFYLSLSVSLMIVCFLVCCVFFMFLMAASFDGPWPLLVACHCQFCSLANKLRSFVRSYDTIMKNVPLKHDAWQFSGYKSLYISLGSRPELKQRLLQVWRSIDHNITDNAIDEWRGRLRSCSCWERVGQSCKNLTSCYWPF